MSTLPLRSPLPNRQPSTRWAPAITASSALATPVPRSLCGWTESTTCSRRSRWRCIHSIWSANTFGVETSTVVGRLMITGRPGPASQVSIAVCDASSATSSSVMQNTSGEYCSTHSVSGWRSVSLRISSTCSRTSAMTSGTVMSKTISRQTGAVALYRWTMARRAPATDRTVCSISSGRAWVITMGLTSSGTWPLSTRPRMKSKSVCEADGKPTSISLKPMRTSSSNRRCLRAEFIGSKSAWLPSRRSVDSQVGAAVMVRDGHWRSGRSIVGNGR